MATVIAHLNVDPDLKKALGDVQADLAALRTTLTAVRVDVAAVRTSFNTAIVKLNADAGVTDADYAQAAALTSSAPSSLNTSAT